MFIPLIVLAGRLIIPFAIPRWPLAGALVAIAADAFDSTIFRAIEFEPAGGYQRYDKLLDAYTLFFELYAVTKLTEVRPRKILTVLFSWRIAGIALFELTHVRQFLFYAPNIFEYLYVLVFGAKRFKSKFDLEKPKNLLILFFAAAVPKVFFEYFHHAREYPLGIGSAFKAIRAWLGF